MCKCPKFLSKKCAKLSHMGWTRFVVSTGNQRMFAAHFFPSKGLPTCLQEAPYVLDV